MGKDNKMNVMAAENDWLDDLLHFLPSSFKAPPL
jgi:hypothetical protein